MDPAAIAAKYQNRAQNSASSKEKEDMRYVAFKLLGEHFFTLTFSVI